MDRIFCRAVIVVFSDVRMQPRPCPLSGKFHICSNTSTFFHLPSNSPSSPSSSNCSSSSFLLSSCLESNSISTISLLPSGLIATQQGDTSPSISSTTLFACFRVAVPGWLARSWSPVQPPLLLHHLFPLLSSPVGGGGGLPDDCQPWGLLAEAGAGAGGE